MKNMFYRKLTVLLLLTFNAGAFAQKIDTWKPNVQQAQAVGTICQGWRQIAVGVYLLKEASQPKFRGRSSLESVIINEIYSPKSTVLTKEMAASFGEQACMPIMKEKFRLGELVAGPNGVRHGKKIH